MTVNWPPRSGNTNMITKAAYAKSSVFKTSEFVFPDRTLLAVITNSLKPTDKLTYNKLMPVPDVTQRIVTVQPHTLINYENGVSNKISISWATTAPCKNTSAEISEEWKPTESKRAIIENEHHAPQSKVAKRRWSDKDGTHTHTPNARKKQKAMTCTNRASP